MCAVLVFIYTVAWCRLNDHFDDAIEPVQLKQVEQSEQDIGHNLHPEKDFRLLGDVEDVVWLNLSDKNHEHKYDARKEETKRKEPIHGKEHKMIGHFVF